MVDVDGYNLIVHTSTTGKVQFASPGKDGCFVFHPGPNGVIDSLPNSKLPLGDDRAAHQDNNGIDIEWIK